MTEKDLDFWKKYFSTFVFRQWVLLSRILLKEIFIYISTNQRLLMDSRFVKQIFLFSRFAPKTKTCIYVFFWRKKSLNCSFLEVLFLWSKILDQNQKHFNIFFVAEESYILKLARQHQTNIVSYIYKLWKITYFLKSFLHMMPFFLN